jgi:pimeloyl-ACP methyl ester carboxylesterase
VIEIVTTTADKLSRTIRGLAAGGLTLGFALTAAAAPAGASGAVNVATCRSAAHPTPVVLLHGLTANKDEDINSLQGWLAQRGYCTFSLTYGAWPIAPFIGGVRPVADSAAQIKAFIVKVLAETGAPKVDIVGHSEGGFQSLYVTKTQGIANRIDKVVAIAPPAHGTTFGGLYALAYLDGQTTRQLTDALLRTIQCPACSELGPDGKAVNVLNDGPIAQPGVHYTVITSTTDELVTPTTNAFVREPGVVNEYVQKFCPSDRVGHFGEAYDPNVWHLVANALDPTHAATFSCVLGPAV